MPSIVCTAKASYKKLPGTLELTDSHLQWTQDGKKAPLVRVPYQDASCEPHHASLLTAPALTLVHSSAFLQQRRCCSGQTQARSRQRRCGTQFYVFCGAARRGLYGAGDVQDGVDQHHQSESQRWWCGWCDAGADPQGSCDGRVDVDPFESRDACCACVVESVDVPRDVCRERCEDADFVGTRRGDGI